MELRSLKWQIFTVSHLSDRFSGAVPDIHGSGNGQRYFLSRYTLPFLPVAGWQAWARTLHMLSAYWGFVVISLHLGLHWSVMLGMARRILPSRLRPRTVRTVGLLIAGYGMYAFVKREIGSYMFLKTQFVFFDFDEPVALFLLDYMAVMVLFVCIGHYLSGWLKRIGRKGPTG